MISGADISLRSTFATNTVMSRELALRLREEVKKREFAESESQKKKDKQEEKDRNEAEREALIATMVLATDAQVAAFDTRLDLYDSASVEALLANEREWKEVKDRIDLNLSQATQLPDGRRVFKSEDGTKVFDEFGVEIAPDDFSPDEIPDSKRRFEPYWRDVQNAETLVEERDQIHDFVADVEKARETTHKKGITADELDKLQDEIDAAAPKRVSALVAGRIDLTQEASHSDQDNHADLDTLDIPTRRNVGSTGPSGP